MVLKSRGLSYSLAATVLFLVARPRTRPWLALYRSQGTRSRSLSPIVQEATGLPLTRQRRRKELAESLCHETVIDLGRVIRATIAPRDLYPRYVGSGVFTTELPIPSN